MTCVMQYLTGIACSGALRCNTPRAHRPAAYSRLSTDVFQLREVSAKTNRGGVVRTVCVALNEAVLNPQKSPFPSILIDI